MVNGGVGAAESGSQQYASNSGSQGYGEGHNQASDAQFEQFGFGN